MKNNRKPATQTRNRCLPGGALLLLLAILAQPAEAVVLDFEDLSTPVTVGDQYARPPYNYGITFNFEEAVDYSGLPGLVHGTKAIELCWGVEFCTVPLEMKFTAPQKRVKVWAGYAADLAVQGAGQGTIILRAFDANGQVGEARVVIGSSPSGVPIQALEVSRPDAVIVRATVGFVEAEGSLPTLNNNFLVVDDVEFDIAGPPPPCLATQPPVVNFISPVPGTPHNNVQFNEFILEYDVMTEDPFARLTISVTGSGGSRSTTDYTSSGHYGPIRADGFLFPGVNHLSLEVQDCRGSSTATAQVNFAPIDPNERIQVLGMEVTQCIQDLNNSVPLIAGKRTFVRVYPVLQGSTAIIPNVSGFLYACRPFLGTTFCQSTLGSIQSLNTIDVTGTPDVVSKRIDLKQSLNFELPAEWITEGNVHLEIAFRINDWVSLPCDGCDNLDRFGTLAYVQFQNAPPVRLKLVSVGPAVSAATDFPTLDEIDSSASSVMRQFPTADLQVDENEFIIFADAPLQVDTDAHRTDSIHRVWDQLASFREWDLASGVAQPQTKYYGLLAAPATGQVGLLGITRGSPGTIAAGFSDACAHELGHCYGRCHPQFRVDVGSGLCSPAMLPGCVDGNYPYANGSISGPDLRFFGLDSGDSTLTLPVAVQVPISGGSGVADIMSYCSPKWMSDYTYSGILSSLRSIEPAIVTAHAVSGSATVPGTDTLLVLGSINLTRGTIDLQPFWRYPGFALSARPATSRYSIRLLDVKGRLLASYPFALDEDTDIPLGQDQTAMIVQVVPYLASTSKIGIYIDNQEVASRLVSRHSPKVMNVKIKPKDDSTSGNKFPSLYWEASHADGDKLTYNVQYSTDGGINWQMLAAGLQNRALDLHFEQLRGSDHAKFRVIASDGVNTGASDSDGSLVVSNKPPLAQITSPATGSSFSTAQAIVFVGQATDLEDGTLPGSALQWSSDVQGPLGTGKSITVSSLAPGPHVVTLTATDKSGATNEARIGIQVTPELARADAGPDRTVAVGADVQLDGSHSTGFGTLSYKWQLPVSPAGSQVTINNPNSAQTDFVADVAGQYEVQLTVKDAFGGGGITRLTVTAH
jgi:hypothetical protein